MCTSDAAHVRLKCSATVLLQTWADLPPHWLALRLSKLLNLARCHLSAQVFELTAELAAARRTAEAAQEEARQTRAAGQQAHATLQQLLLNGAPQLVQPPPMVLLGPGLFGQARPAQAQQVQHVQQQAVQAYASPLIVQQVPPRLQLPAQHRPAGAPSQSPSPRFAQPQPQPQPQPPSPRATQPLPSQSPSPRFAAQQPRQPASPRSAQPLLLTPQSGPPRLPAGLQLTPSQLQQLQQASARQPPPLPPPVQVPTPRAAAPPGQPAASPPLSPQCLLQAHREPLQRQGLSRRLQHLPLPQPAALQGTGRPWCLLSPSDPWRCRLAHTPLCSACCSSTRHGSRQHFGRRCLRSRPWHSRRQVISWTLLLITFATLESQRVGL